MAASVRLEFFQSEAGARVKMDIKHHVKEKKLYYMKNTLR